MTGRDISGLLVIASLVRGVAIQLVVKLEIQKSNYFVWVLFNNFSNVLWLEDLLLFVF